MDKLDRRGNTLLLVLMIGTLLGLLLLGVVRRAGGQAGTQARVVTDRMATDANRSAMGLVNELITAGVVQGWKPSEGPYGTSWGVQPPNPASVSGWWDFHSGFAQTVDPSAQAWVGVNVCNGHLLNSGDLAQSFVANPVFPAACKPGVTGDKVLPVRVSFVDGTCSPACTVDLVSAVTVWLLKADRARPTTKWAGFFLTGFEGEFEPVMRTMKRRVPFVPVVPR